MSLRNVDISSALRRVAVRRIEEAIQQGKFDNLPGKGKPLDLEPMPAEENARLMWWALRLLKQNDVIPDEVRLRKTIEGIRERLNVATSAVEVTRLVKDVNAAVRQLNTMGTTAMPIACAPVILEAELERFRRRHR